MAHMLMYAYFDAPYRMRYHWQGAGWANIRFFTAFLLQFAGGHLQAVSEGGRIFCGPEATDKAKAHFERVLNVNNDVDPAALRGIVGMFRPPHSEKGWFASGWLDTLHDWNPGRLTNNTIR